jgi:opacity protein-like surface antigen
MIPAMRRPFLLLLLAALASPAMAQSPKENQPNTFALTLKTGDIRLVDDSQTISGNERIFDRSADSVFAIEGEGRLQGEAENLSLGGESLRYKNHFRRASTAGVGFEDTLYTQAFLIKSKYYFRPGKAWQPYLGGGIGTVWSEDFGGPVRGIANATAYQAVLGMQLRAARVGIRVEYMYLRARETDNDGQKVDVSSRGLFVGLSFFFGRR